MSLRKLVRSLKGGPGSGHHGHGGRPGKRGGSAPGGGGGVMNMSDISKVSPALHSAVMNVASSSGVGVSRARETVIDSDSMKKVPGAARAANFYAGKTIGQVISKADVKREMGSMWDEKRDAAEWERQKKFPALEWASVGESSYMAALHKRAPGGSDFNALMDDVFLK